MRALAKNWTQKETFLMTPQATHSHIPDPVQPDGLGRLFVEGKEASQIKMESIVPLQLGLRAKKSNTNRKVYRSFFKISKDRSIVANIDYRNDKLEIISLTDALVLPEFIEWGQFRLNRKTLLLTNLAISPRRQECVLVSV